MDTCYDIRPLADDELEAALALWARTDHLGPVPLVELTELRAHDGGLVLAAVMDATLVGVVLGSYDGRRGWINRLAVDPAHRRRGVARGLVAEVERRLVDRGCRQVNLLVFRENRSGRALWEELGYDGSDAVALYSRRLGSDGPDGAGPPVGDPAGDCGAPGC